MIARVHYGIKESFHIQHTLQSVIDFMKSMGLELSEEEVQMLVDLLIWTSSLMEYGFVVKKTLTKPLRTVSASSFIIMSYPF